MIFALYWYFAGLVGVLISIKMHRNQESFFFLFAKIGR